MRWGKSNDAGMLVTLVFSVPDGSPGTVSCTCAVAAVAPGTTRTVSVAAVAVRLRLTAVTVV